MLLSRPHGLVGQHWLEADNLQQIATMTRSRFIVTDTSPGPSPQPPGRWGRLVGRVGAIWSEWGALVVPLVVRIAQRFRRK